uniref:Uncharacterized protein n=1 Tax=Populus trichocarpa TaxID=3694 RepID=A0A2K2AX37_POPTR
MCPIFMRAYRLPLLRTSKKIRYKSLTISEVCQGASPSNYGSRCLAIKRIGIISMVYFFFLHLFFVVGVLLP